MQRPPRMSIETEDHLLSSSGALNENRLQMELKRHLHGLHQASAELHEALMSDKSLAKSPRAASWFELCEPCLVGKGHDFIQGKRAFNLASKIFSQFHYRSPIQEPRQTAMAVGYVMAGTRCIEAAQAVNHAKYEFERFVVSLTEYSGMKNVFRRNQKVQDLLQGVGAGRLCLQQVYRRIPIVDYELRRIAFAWVTKPALKKITPLQACELLENLMRRYPDSQVVYQEQHKRLRQLSDATPLVRELQISTGMKARLSAVVAQTTSRGSPYYPRITASMPLLLAAQTQAPELVLPRLKSDVEGKLGGPKSQRGELLAASINVWGKT